LRDSSSVKRAEIYNREIELERREENEKFRIQNGEPPAGVLDKVEILWLLVDRFGKGRGKIGKKRMENLEWRI